MFRTLHLDVARRINNAGLELYIFVFDKHTDEEKFVLGQSASNVPCFLALLGASRLNFGFGATYVLWSSLAASVICFTVFLPDATPWRFYKRQLVQQTPRHLEWLRRLGTRVSEDSTSPSGRGTRIQRPNIM